MHNIIEMRQKKNWLQTTKERFKDDDDNAVVNVNAATNTTVDDS